MKQFSFFIFLFFFISSCSSSRATGNEQQDKFPDLYYFQKSISRPYTVLGRRLFEGNFLTETAEGRAAKYKAKQYGADAVVIEEELIVNQGWVVNSTQVTDTLPTGVRTTTQTNAPGASYTVVRFLVFVQYLDK